LGPDPKKNIRFEKIAEPIDVDKEDESQNSQASLRVRKCNDLNATYKPRGRPKLKPLYFSTDMIYEKISENIYEEFKYIEEVEKDRTDSVRLKLIRKAISIPYLILKFTHRENTIKNLTNETAESVYKKCYNEFLNLCCIILQDQATSLLLKPDNNLFVAFISLKYPENKVTPLLSEGEMEVFMEMKKYLKCLSIKSLFKVKHYAVWEILKALFKITSFIIQTKISHDFHITLDSLASKLEVKLRQLKKQTSRQLIYSDEESEGEVKEEMESSIQTEDKY
jgi:hypothetical protein